MNAKARNARQTLRQRSAATRFNASLKRGRAMATHVIAAGITDPTTIKGMATALQGVARRTGMEPAKVTRTRNTVDGKGGRMARLRTRGADRTRREPKSFKVNHYTAAQVQTLLNTYKPRKAAYVAAKRVLINA